MNDHDADHGADRVSHGRVAELLRSAGVVEHEPPVRVWRAVEHGLRGRPTGAALAPVVPIASVRPRGRGGRWLVAAAAAGALLTWTGLELTGADTARDPGQVVASGDLAALTEAGTTGRAEVVTVAGQQRLRVQLESDPDAGNGYLEVWLLRPDVSGMVTLGVLDGRTADFPLPEGLDVTEFAVVDISREHLDGDPGHGGDSLVRGEVG